MKDLTLVSHVDERPLPLIVAEKWGFELAYVEETNQYWYSIHDWMRGVLRINPRQTTKLWTAMQEREGEQLSIPDGQYAYVAENGKTYVMDFTTDKGLYIITQGFRVTKQRPLLKQIRDYLAKAGAFVDLVRIKPETVIESGAVDPDKAIEAAIAEYKRRGKSDTWIQARLLGKVKREMFTTALKAAMADIMRKHYGMATNEVYFGLWNRTAEILREQMKLPPTANLRDHQPSMGLHLQAMVEEGCAIKLGKRQELSWEEASEIIRDVAHHFGQFVPSTNQFFGMDIATGKPLLESGQ